MTQSTPSQTPPASSSRPVLLWQEEGDMTRVEPSLEMAAQFLKVTVEEAQAAIEGGEQLGGWFVDWEAQATS